MEPNTVVKPIRPSDVGKKKTGVIPEEVIEIFNELIAKNFCSGFAEIMTEDVCLEICKRLKCSMIEVFSKGYLDVEMIYRKSGWDVTYDAPGYNETYKAFYIFRVKK